MPSFMTYVIAGGAVLMVMDIAAPPAGIGLPHLSWPAIEQRAGAQIVNRASKGDRLPLPLARKPAVPTQPAKKILAGCEPVFSPLSAAAQPNFLRRCIAGILQRIFA